MKNIEKIVLYTISLYIKAPFQKLSAQAASESMSNKDWERAAVVIKTAVLQIWIINIMISRMLL